MARSTSGTWNYQPAVAECVIEAYERIGIYGPALSDARYIISARRTANLLLADWGNRNVSLWVVGDEPLCIPLQPGETVYQLPRNVVELLDCYLRTYTPDTATTALGAGLHPMLVNGKPIITGGGSPVLMGDPSGTLSSVAGEQLVTLRWPGHGLVAGDPVFWTMPVSVGELLLQNMSIVETVVDSNTVTLMAPEPAPLTSFGQGATALYATSPGIPLVGAILPNHGLIVGDEWTVHVATTVGGLTIAPGTYDVEYVQNSYTFHFNPTAIPTRLILSDDGRVLTDDDGNPLVAEDGGATSYDAVFENRGRIIVATQLASVDYTDVYLWPLSRNEYAMLPNKRSQGRPTQYWFNRSVVPSITMWPVPPQPSTATNLTTGIPTPTNLYYGLVAYRMRSIQDADPVDGQALDMPPRFYQAFVAELTAGLAEKFKPEVFEEKLKLAAIRWESASSADTERVSTFIQPTFDSYYR